MNDRVPALPPRADPRRGNGAHRIGKLVFVVGCPRSGTTWLQLLLSQHPDVATGQETHLFSRYLRRLDARWQQEADDHGRKVGLQASLTRPQFDGLLRDFADGVFSRLASTKPGATVLVEKTPNHVHDWELMLRLFPDAWFLHVIRDPRGVVCSLRHASRTWGADWAPEGVIEAATAWARAVEEGRRIASATPRYKEVRYEDLESRGAETLLDTMHWLKLEAGRRFAEAALAACRIENLLPGSSGPAVPWRLEQEPEGFYRQGRSDGWKDELSIGQMRLIEHVSDALMQDLHYARVTPRRRVKPLRLFLHQAVSTVLRRLLGTGAVARLVAWMRKREGSR